MTVVTNTVSTVDAKVVETIKNIRQEVVQAVGNVVNFTQDTYKEGKTL